MAIIVGVLEMITVFWIYGLSNFINDVEFMLGGRPSFYWRLCWAFITPILMIVILIYTVVTYESPTYDNMPFPDYAYGWCFHFIFIFFFFLVNSILLPI